ncbi:MAG: serine/threonine-protein phosphatase [Anaerolineae bacterium]|nr:serine/threonine-protein phosphatase [Anaerolineae bacterium]
MAALNRWLRDLFGGGRGSEGAASVGPTRGAVPSTVLETAPGLEIREPVSLLPSDGGPVAGDVTGAFRVGSKTHTGKVRDHNEDAVLVLTSHLDATPTSPDFGLFMVADGMGGHQNGEAASALALRVSAGQLVNQVYVSLLAGADRGANQPALTDVIRDAVVQANRVVSQRLPGSGCTLTCGMVVGGRLFIGHVGDSRAYVRRADGSLVKLTRDHTFVNRLIEVGQITAEDAVQHPQRNVLYRAIGQPEDLEVDVVTRSLAHGDRLLLCSDGLWNLLPDKAISDLASLADPQAACDALVDAANAAGGIDNISVVLVELARH